MQTIEYRLVDKFQEPGFMEMQRLVFADIQQYSPALADAQRAEADTFPPAPPPERYAPMLRVGAYRGDEWLGWSSGWLERGRVFYMGSSGVLPSARRLGIYSGLVQAVRERARALGAVQLRSQHSVLNNAVLIAKLRLGFQVSGLSQSAQTGLLVELTQHLSPSRQDIVRARSMPFFGDAA